MNKRLVFFIALVSVFGFVFLFYYKERIQSALIAPDAFSLIIYNLKRLTALESFSWRTILMSTLVTISCFIIEIIAIGWRKSSLYRLLFIRDKSTRGDVWCWLLSLFYVYNIFVLLFSFGICYVVTSLIIKSFDFHFVSYISSPVFQFIIILLLSDLKHYIRHALSHKIPWLWEIHKYHHSAEHMNMITAQRGHFLETAYISLFDAILFVIVGSPAENYIAILLLRETHILFSHSNVNWHWGWIGKYILVSPAAHRIHHSTSSDHYDRNFGNMFIFWDRLFNTWFNPKENKTAVNVGLIDNPYNKTNFFSDMLLFYKSLLTKKT